MRRPVPGEYAPYYEQYMYKVTGSDILQILQDSGDGLIRIFSGLTPEQEEYAYAPDKWKLREVLQHIIDCDLVFLYRAMSIARDPSIAQPGFDENLWAKNAERNAKETAALLREFQMLRALIVKMFGGMTLEDLDKKGQANGHNLSVLSIAYIIAGHTLHHIASIKERYL